MALLQKRVGLAILENLGNFCGRFGLVSKSSKFRVNCRSSTYVKACVAKFFGFFVLEPYYSSKTVCILVIQNVLVDIYYFDFAC